VLDSVLTSNMNNCLDEIFFDQAVARAEELDEYFKIRGTTVGPLHGLPISLKDQFHVKGNDTSMGYIGWLDTYNGSKDKRLVHKMNSQIVSELLSLGAVLFCKASIQIVLYYGC
jgi:amidase